MGILVEFWRRRKLPLRDFGQYHIFEVLGGNHNMKYIYIRTDPEDFNDFDCIDEYNRIRYTSELYKLIMQTDEDGKLDYFNSISECYQDILINIYHKDHSEETMIELFKILSNLGTNVTFNR